MVGIGAVIGGVGGRERAFSEAASEGGRGSEGRMGFGGSFGG